MIFKSMSPKTNSQEAAVAPSDLIKSFSFTIKNTHIQILGNLYPSLLFFRHVHPCVYLPFNFTQPPESKSQ